nr:MAG TPA: integrase [Caudoviricetes sp.]
MSNITIIPARPQRTNQQQSEAEKPKLRVAAYCRVSTDSDEQATSYETQVTHYTEYITGNPEWSFAGVYADDGISGTNTKKREEFNRMITDCMDGKIDMVITKSISRFARNTLDCLKYIRQLKDRNIPVFFEKENINTLDAKGEVLLTIMASLAQQESMSLSQNVKLGLQFRYQRGEVQVNHSRFLGYTKDENGRLVIDPEQAEVVRRIYREYLDGYSGDKIAAGLERDGILTGAGNPHWHTSTIAKILRNEKYMGDALLQKTYTVDYLSKKRIKNNGIMPQYYVENDHEAIIPKEIFMRVQDELVRRRLVKVSPNGRKHGFSSNHVFSQMIVCGECGELFRRVHWNNHGCRSIVWRCLSRLQSTGVVCHARTVNEEVLKKVVMQAFNELLRNKSAYQKRLRDNLAVVLCGYSDDEALEIDKRLAELQQELINHASRKEDYNDIADEIFWLREMKQKNFTDTAVRDEQVKRINELNDFISQQDTELTEFDESLARRWLKEITIWSDRITVELKSWMSIEIKI